MVLTAPNRAAGLRCVAATAAIVCVAVVPALSLDPPAGTQSDAAGVTLRGRVELRRQSGTVARRPNAAELGMPPGHDMPDRNAAPNIAKPTLTNARPRYCVLAVDILTSSVHGVRAVLAPIVSVLPIP